MRWQMIIHDESEVQDMFGANDDMFVASLFHEMVETNARFGVICFPLPCTHCSVSGRSEKLATYLVYFMRYLCSWNRVFQRLGGHA